MASRNYYQKLNKETKAVTRKILSKHFSTPGKWTPIQASACLHYYIKHKIPYQTRNETGGRRRLRGPVETWKHGGNCEEKTILLCNLLHNIKGIQTQMLAVGITPGEDGHLLPEVGFPNSIPEITSKLDSYYQYLENQHGYKTFGREYSYSDDPQNNIVWYVADPDGSQYIGDIRSLVSEGYIRQKGNSWEWVLKDETITP